MSIATVLPQHADGDDDIFDGYSPSRPSDNIRGPLKSGFPNDAASSHLAKPCYRPQFDEDAGPEDDRRATRRAGPDNDRRATRSADEAWETELYPVFSRNQPRKFAKLAGDEEAPSGELPSKSNARMASRPASDIALLAAGSLRSQAAVPGLLRRASICTLWCAMVTTIACGSVAMIGGRLAAALIQQQHPSIPPAFPPTPPLPPSPPLPSAPLPIAPPPPSAPPLRVAAAPDQPTPLPPAAKRFASTP